MKTLQTTARSLFAGLLIAGTVMGTTQVQAASPMQLNPTAVVSVAKTGATAAQTVDYRGRGDRGGWHDGRREFRPLGPREIRRSLRHRGFRAIDIVDRQRGTYVVRAIGWRGHPVKLVVDARTAEILRRAPIHRGGGRNGPRGSFEWSYTW